VSHPPLRTPSILSLIAALLLVVASCRSVPSDQVARNGEQVAAFDTFAARLLDLRLSPNPSLLVRLRSELDRAAEQPGMNRRLQARGEALKAEAALLAGDLAAAKRSADAAAALSDSEEGVWIVRAGVETDPGKQLALIEAGIAKADGKSRLLCERGELLLKAGRYAEAAQDLDEGLRGLDAAYRGLYGQDRERAFSLAQAARDSGSVAPTDRPGTLETQITMHAMVEGALSETRLIAALSPDPKPSYGSLLPALKGAGLLLDPAASPDAPALRKSVAFFLWGIISRTEHDPKLLTRYRLKYASSPVPDVAADAPWFDAVLGVVEREIMDLPDGVNFNPEGQVTGLEYLGMLGRLNKLYR
jgi:tetratricopeptide (TPR) repeat protein